MTVMRSLIGVIVAVLLSASSAMAGAFEDGEAAYKLKGYGTALRLFRPLAEQGDARAQVYLGWMYFYGEGVQEDVTEAAKWFSKAADEGSAEGEDELGWFYDMGWGVPMDRARAQKLYRLAAEQGYAPAQFRVGYTYTVKGDGQDFIEAAKWFRKAAEQGDGDAQFQLGILYYHGNGVPKDNVQAYMWFSLAAARGITGFPDLPSEDRRDWVIKLPSEMTPDQIAEAQRLAREWKPTSGQSSPTPSRLYK
jgi:TPR repeat protein